ncbi:retrovirus-related pol polyprotein from transposon TNT 1-94 [Tanacetum coccineum]
MDSRSPSTTYKCDRIQVGLSNKIPCRWKARLVAQGFKQIAGFDFSHSFSPVVKATTVRIVLFLEVTNQWNLHQLYETVYIEQPPGYIDQRYPNHVCRLNKALYALRQAPRAWFQRLSSLLVNQGFQCSQGDTSLFIFHHGSCLLYLLVYVDDIILTRNHEPTVASFINRLKTEFAIKDLGKLIYFLGLEVSYTSDGLFLSQSKYAHDILSRVGLLDSKPVGTPLTIMRYVKGTLTHGVHFSCPKKSMLIGYSNANWHVALTTATQLTGILFSLVGISSLGVLRSNQPFPVLVVSPNAGLCQILSPNLFGFLICYVTSMHYHVKAPHRVGGDGGAGEGDGVLENPKENQSWEEDEGILSFRRFWSN